MASEPRIVNERRLWTGLALMALPAANFPVMWVVVLVTGLNTGELPDIVETLLPGYIVGSFLFLLAIPIGIYFVVTQ